MKAAAKKMGWSEFRTVQACFGFWFDVSREDGVVYKFTSCANYFNEGASTRTLRDAEKKRLLAVLDTVSAIPKTKVDSSNKPKQPKPTAQKKCKEAAATNREKAKKVAEKKAPACKGTVKKNNAPCSNQARDGTPFCRKHQSKATSRPAAIVVSDSGSDSDSDSDLGFWVDGDYYKYSDYGSKCTKPRPTVPKKRKTEVARKPEAHKNCKNAKTVAGEYRRCEGIVGTTGDDCTAPPQGGSKYCGRHQSQGICLARVKDHGLRCEYKHYEGSRWCGVHFPEWHGKDTPKW